MTALPWRVLRRLSPLERSLIESFRILEPRDAAKTFATEAATQHMCNQRKVRTYHGDTKTRRNQKPVSPSFATLEDRLRRGGNPEKSRIWSLKGSNVSAGERFAGQLMMQSHGDHPIRTYNLSSMPITKYEGLTLTQ